MHSYRYALRRLDSLARHGQRMTTTATRWLSNQCNCLSPTVSDAKLQAVQQCLWACLRLVQECPRTTFTDVLAVRMAHASVRVFTLPERTAVRIVVSALRRCFEGDQPLTTALHHAAVALAPVLCAVTSNPDVLSEDMDSADVVLLCWAKCVRLSVAAAEITCTTPGVWLSWTNTVDYVSAQRSAQKVPNSVPAIGRLGFAAAMFAHSVLQHTTAVPQLVLDVCHGKCVGPGVLALLRCFSTHLVLCGDHGPRTDGHEESASRCLQIVSMATVCLLRLTTMGHSSSLGMSNAESCSTLLASAVTLSRVGDTHEIVGLLLSVAASLLPFSQSGSSPPQHLRRCQFAVSAAGPHLASLLRMVASALRDFGNHDHKAVAVYAQDACSLVEAACYDQVTASSVMVAPEARQLFEVGVLHTLPAPALVCLLQPIVSMVSTAVTHCTVQARRDFAGAVGGGVRALVSAINHAKSLKQWTLVSTVLKLLPPLVDACTGCSSLLEAVIHDDVGLVETLVSCLGAPAGKGTAAPAAEQRVSMQAISLLVSVSVALDSVGASGPFLHAVVACGLPTRLANLVHTSVDSRLGEPATSLLCSMLMSSHIPLAQKREWGISLCVEAWLSSIGDAEVVQDRPILGMISLMNAWLRCGGCVADTALVSATKVMLRGVNTDAALDGVQERTWKAWMDILTVVADSRPSPVVATRLLVTSKQVLSRWRELPPNLVDTSLRVIQTLVSLQGTALRIGKGAAHDSMSAMDPVPSDVDGGCSDATPIGAGAWASVGVVDESTPKCPIAPLETCVSVWNKRHAIRCRQVAGSPVAGLVVAMLCSPEGVGRTKNDSVTAHGSLLSSHRMLPSSVITKCLLIISAITVDEATFCALQEVCTGSGIASVPLTTAVSRLLSFCLPTPRSLPHRVDNELVTAACRCAATLSMFRRVVHPSFVMRRLDLPPGSLTSVELHGVLLVAEALVKAGRDWELQELEVVARLAGACAAFHHIDEPIRKMCRSLMRAISTRGHEQGVEPSSCKIDVDT